MTSGSIFLGGSTINSDEFGVNITPNLRIPQNLTVDSYFFLSNDYSLPPGQNKILKRNTATKAVFGVQNEISSASTDSGAGYVLNTTVAEYRLDLHSAEDLNNPNETVHHLIGANINEIWRLNPTIDSEFRFEGGLHLELFKMNRTMITIGNTTSIMNLTINGNIGLNGNFTNGNCWTAYQGGIAYSTNCTAS